LGSAPAPPPAVPQSDVKAVRKSVSGLMKHAERLEWFPAALSAAIIADLAPGHRRVENARGLLSLKINSQFDKI
jgi:hypothetical protein